VYDKSCTHFAYALGSNAGERRKRYAELVAEGFKKEEVELFRRCASKGLPAGSDQFKREIEAALTTRIGDGQRGRPKKRSDPISPMGYPLLAGPDIPATGRLLATMTQTPVLRS